MCQWLDLQVSSYRRKPTVIVLSVGIGSSFRYFSSADSWGTYYFPNLRPISNPQFFPLEWNQTSREVSIADYWETCHQLTESYPDIPPADCLFSSNPVCWKGLRQLIGVNFLIVEKSTHARYHTHSSVRWGEIRLQDRCQLLTVVRTIIKQLNLSPISHLIIVETVLIMSVVRVSDNW